MNEKILRNRSITRAVRSSNKYHNEKPTLDGMRFDSKKEACRWQELKLLQSAGAIQDLQRQVRFELVPKTPDERPVHYIADFTYMQDENLIVEDVKGLKTRDYIVKRKLFKYCHPECIFRET